MADEEVVLTTRQKYLQKYYLDNRERLIAYHRQYRRDNHAKLKATRKIVTAKNKKHLKAYYREYYLKNKARILARQQATKIQRQANKEKLTHET